MRILIRNLPNQGNISLDTSRVRIGAAPDNDVILEDPGITRHHATITQAKEGASAGISLTALAPFAVRLNGTVVNRCALIEGDKCIIGNHIFLVQRITEGYDIILDFLGLDDTPYVAQDYHQKQSLNFLSLHRFTLSTRGRNWLVVLACLILFVLLPVSTLISTRMDELLSNQLPLFDEQSYSVGQITRYHQRIQYDCAVCHKNSFEVVPRAACTKCHEDIPHHYNKSVADAIKMDMPDCGTCHQEHFGDNGLILEFRDEACRECHFEIHDFYPDSKTLDIGENFKTGHPEFRLSLPLKPADSNALPIRVHQNTQNPVKQESGFKFPHDVHLEKSGVLAPDGEGTVKEVLECWSCHKQDPDTGVMAPIDFETQCHKCHSLNFDAFMPKIELPHAQPEKIRPFLENLYTHNGDLPRTLPHIVQHSKDERRLPGRLYIRSASDDTGPMLGNSEFVGELSQLVLEKGVCSDCHTTEPDPKASGLLTISKPDLTNSWYPKSTFNHKRHSLFGCEGCHDVRKSSESTDINIPGKSNCVECHNEDNSSCVSCHTLHRSKTLLISGEPIAKKIEKKLDWHPHPEVEKHPDAN